jgi:hypothetical protein
MENRFHPGSRSIWSRLKSAKRELPERAPYTYEQLPSDSSFRILELLPGRKKDAVAFRLHIEDWNSPPSYEAISYAWGAGEKVPVICNHRILNVTSNLRDGLRRMRLKNRSRFLWADAACIDQSNDKERGHQVSNMRLVYNKSSKVLVWLGEDEDRLAPKAIAAMNQIASTCCANANILVSQLNTFDDITCFVMGLADPVINGIDPRSWDSIFGFFSRPWFR